MPAWSKPQETQAAMSPLADRAPPAYVSHSTSLPCLTFIFGLSCRLERRHSDPQRHRSHITLPNVHWSRRPGSSALSSHLYNDVLHTTSCLPLYSSIYPRTSPHFHLRVRHHNHSLHDHSSLSKYPDFVISYQPLLLIPRLGPRTSTIEFDLFTHSQPNKCHTCREIEIVFSHLSPHCSLRQATFVGQMDWEPPDLARMTSNAILTSVRTALPRKSAKTVSTQTIWTNLSILRTRRKTSHQVGSLH